MSDHMDVGEFHEKFGLHNTNWHEVGPTGAEKNAELMSFRLKFMVEELTEFTEALEAGDIAGMADALVDLNYVVLGTAHLLGLPWNKLWDDVQRANLSKERAAADGSNSKRGSSFDVIKPEGWVGPDGKSILAKYGFEVSE